MSTTKFVDNKDKIQKALEKKLIETPITGENGFTLIEGFMTFSNNLYRPDMSSKPLHDHRCNGVLCTNPQKWSFH